MAKIQLAIVTVAALVMFIAMPCTGQGVRRDEAAEWLDAHNYARSAEGMRLRPLRWNMSAFQNALSWTSSSPYCSGNSGTRVFGENVAWYGRTRVTPTDAVTGWVAQRVNYTYESNSCVRGASCEQFTQVVWNRTRSVGCAWAFCSLGGVAGKFFTCNYWPPGNENFNRPY